MMVCTEMDENKSEAFVVKRRERNRLAAQKCRKGKKHHIDNLRAEENQLDCSNTKLKDEIRKLKDQIGQLQFLLKTHQCSGKVRSSYPSPFTTGVSSSNATVRDLLLRHPHKTTALQLQSPHENLISSQFSSGLTKIARDQKTLSLTELLLSKSRLQIPSKELQNTKGSVQCSFESDSQCYADSLPVLKVSDLDSF